ncbi:MAG TPA: site-specific integrase [Kofleriaceae bacterium]
MIDHLVQPPGPKAKPKTLAKVLARKQRRALYCLLIVYGSPRRGELEVLDWSHVDLERGTIAIPKGKTKGRPIAIHEQLRPWLDAMHEGSGPVVDPWSNVTRDLEWAAKRAGLPTAKQKLTPNDLRRTFASWLVQEGVSLYVVSRLLGHSSTRMVELVYGQLDDATLIEAIGRLPGGCDAGVPHELPHVAQPGAGGHSAHPTSIRNSVEESFASSSFEVPRDGVEPPTRGFSVLTELAPKRALSQTKLRVV